MTADDLIAFEKEIEVLFEAGKIAAPVHFAGGNEQQLIDIFKDIKPHDWILCSWRSHYHCLLKGVPPDELKAAIVRGRSIALCFPNQRVLSSAIVGGIAPIAVGLAWGIKRRGGSEKVHCFLGDMTLESGIVHEARKYASYHRLPIQWVVEDNGLSVCTDTKEVWQSANWYWDFNSDTHWYNYTLTWPHVGTGQWVAF